MVKMGLKAGGEDEWRRRVMEMVNTSDDNG